MKIETLNIWGGRVFDPLIEHTKKQGNNIDVFCLQEVYSTPSDKTYTRDSANIPSLPPNEQHPRANIYEELSRVLPNHTGYYRSSITNADSLGEVGFDLSFGLAMFVRNGITVKKEDEVMVYLQKSDFIPGDNTSIPKQIQYVNIVNNGKEYTVANFHGLWTGKGKEDTDARILQSKNIKTFIKEQDSPVILAGDFNLLPGTKSLGIIEEGMKNLVKEYGVTSTRSEFYTKPEKYADYILVSADLEVANFAVLQDQVSDHLPLQAEIR